MLEFKETENIAIPITLGGGEANRRMQVRVYDMNGANLITGVGYLTAAHIEGGYYLTNQPLSLPAGMYTVKINPFLDDDYLIADNKYGTVQDDLKVNGIESFQDVTDVIQDAVATFQIADIEIEIDDEPDQIEIELVD